MKRLSLTTSAIALSFVVAACTAPEKSEDAATAMPETVAEITEAPDHSEEIAAAYAFMERAEAELAAQSHIAAQAYWNQCHEHYARNERRRGGSWCRLYEIGCFTGQ